MWKQKGFCIVVREMALDDQASLQKNNGKRVSFASQTGYGYDKQGTKANYNTLCKKRLS